MTEHIGHRIKLIRRKLGLTMEDFGALFEPKASKGVVSNWENNYNLPNNERLKRISELGKVSMAYLLKGEKADKTEKLKKELLYLQENKMDKTLQIAKIADELSNPNWDEDTKKRLEKILEEHVLAVEKTKEAIEEIKSYIEKSETLEVEINRNKELNKSINGWGDLEDIPLDEMKQKLEKTGYTVYENETPKIELEALFNSAQEITFNGKTLTDIEKQKALQILSITLGS